MFLFGPPNVEKMKARQDIQGLIKALGYQKSEDIRQEAAKALAEIGNSFALEPLIAVLRKDDETPPVRSAAAYALGRIGDSRTIEALIAVFNDEKVAEEPEVRAAVAEALGNLGDVRAVEPLASVFKGQQYKSVLIAAAEALGKIGDARAVQPLIEGLYYSDEVSKVAAKSLVKIGIPAVESLIVVLTDKNKRNEVRKAAAKALGEIGDSRAVEPLIAALDDKDKYVQSAAAEALGRIGDSRAVEPLIAKGKDKDRDMRTVREAAVEALGRIGDTRATEIVITALDEEFAEELKEKAAKALAKVGDIRAVEPLVPLLKAHRYWLRRRALEALTAIAERDTAAKSLIEERGIVLSVLMKESDKEASDFVKALEQIKVGMSVDDLRKLVGPPNFSMDMGTALSAFGRTFGIGENIEGPKALNYNTEFGEFQVQVQNGVVQKVLWVESLLQRLKEIA